MSSIYSFGLQGINPVQIKTYFSKLMLFKELFKTVKVFVVDELCAKLTLWFI